MFCFKSENEFPVYFPALNFKRSYSFSGTIPVAWKKVDFTGMYFMSIPQYLKGDWTGELAWNEDIELVCWGVLWLLIHWPAALQCCHLPCVGAAQGHSKDTYQGVRRKLSRATKTPQFLWSQLPSVGMMNFEYFGSVLFLVPLDFFFFFCGYTKIFKGLYIQCIHLYSIYTQKYLREYIRNIFIYWFKGTRVSRKGITQMCDWYHWNQYTELQSYNSYIDICASLS